MTDFSFNPLTRRYHDNRTKQFISTARVRELVGQSIDAGSDRAEKLTRDLLRQTITVAEWERQMAAEIKTLTIQLYRLGKPDMNSSDYGRIGQMVRQQYARLRKFSRDITLGTQSEAQILNRARMYFSKAREAFEEGDRRGRVLTFRWEKRIRTKRESCRECIVYEAMDWQPIGTLPRPTERCSCRGNCGCKFEYSNSRTRPTTNRVMAGFGWIA